MTIEQAYDLFDEGRYHESEAICIALLKSDPDYFPATYLSGNIKSRIGDYEEAIEFYHRSLILRPTSGTVLFNLAFLAKERGDIKIAIVYINRYININNKDAEAYIFRSTLRIEIRDFYLALEDLDAALCLVPNSPEAFSNKGNCLNELKRFDEALASYDKAISIKSDYAEAFYNRGITLAGLRRFDEAVASYDKAISTKLDYAEAYNNRGITLGELRRFDEALASYDKAISIKSDYAEAFNNCGVTLGELRRFDEALASYDRAISTRSDYADAFYNRGTTLCELKRFDEALTCYGKAISIKPDFQWLYGSWLHIRMQTSEWSGFDEILREFQFKIEDKKSVTPPLPALALFDDLRLNLRAARQWIDEKFPSDQLMEPFKTKIFKSKIRIGYFSADFHNHATAYLMAELFELHDRNSFEFYAFSFGPSSIQEMRQRLEVSFDQFIDVSFQSDQDIARLSRTLAIDIAIDLKGFTQDARTGIFSHRCAPIQVNYIGYPGSMSADYIDYMIADQILIPVESQQFYSEKIVYLPHSYQVNDSKRRISENFFTRTELGLPDDGFVFCCFNNSYKILPDIFDSWMRILQAVEGSVLWLLDDNKTSTHNLRREASNRGVSPDRLVFAKRMPIADHLARHRHADLFLDTLPYNAHTTASDALWAGLPVLTRIGQSFAARVAASLLNAVGLPELITTSAEEYEQCAVNLATHPDQMRALKQKLADTRLSSNLFNTPLYVRHLEAAYLSMYERYQDGLGPDHIYFQEETKTSE